MFSKLKQLIESGLEEASGKDDTKPSTRLAHLAATALLLEVGHADHHMDVKETAAILSSVKQVFGIDESDIEKFFSEAEQQKHDSISLYEFTDVINREFDEAAKYELICELWRVAYSDGELDRYEDHTIRKIAELIYVSHSEFIRAKHLVAKDN